MNEAAACGHSWSRVIYQVITPVIGREMDEFAAGTISANDLGIEGAEQCIISTGEGQAFSSSLRLKEKNEGDCRIEETFDQLSATDCQTAKSSAGICLTSNIVSRPSRIGLHSVNFPRRPPGLTRPGLRA